MKIKFSLTFYILLIFTLFLAFACSTYVGKDNSESYVLNYGTKLSTDTVLFYLNKLKSIEPTYNIPEKFRKYCDDHQGLYPKQTYLYFDRNPEEIYHISSMPETIELCSVLIPEINDEFLVKNELNSTQLERIDLRMKMIINKIDSLAKK